MATELEVSTSDKNNSVPVIDTNNKQCDMLSKPDCYKPQRKISANRQNSRIPTISESEREERDDYDGLQLAIDEQNNFSNGNCHGEDYNETLTSLSGQPLLSKSSTIQRVSRKRDIRDIKAERRKEWDAARARFKPLDSGYAWVVALAAFLVQFWVAGLIKSFGVLFLEVLQEFPDSSASTASWIPAILSTLALTLSPVASALCQRFTCRSVVLSGGILCCVGISLSYFATSIVHLYLTFGVLTGIGAGLTTTPGIVMVARYFHNRRALANGICVSGTAAGGLVIPWLLEHLIDNYGFRGCLLILGACTLHVCVGGALYRPPAIHQFITEADERRKQKVIRKPSIQVTNHSQGMETNSVPETMHNNSNSSVSLCQFYDQRIKNPQPVSPETASVNIPMLQEEKPTTVTSVPDLRRCNSTFLHSVEDMHTDSTCVYKDQMNNPDLPKPKRTGCSKYVDFDLMRSPVFLLLAFSVMLMAAGCPYALFYIPAYAALDKGFSKNEVSMLISINAILDLTGRLSFGFIADKHLFSNRLAYMASILLAGVAVISIPWMNSFVGLTICVSVYGICLGTWFLLIPVLLTDNFGTDGIASSYGLIRVFQGLMGLAVPPIAGLLKDETGTYKTCFYFMGSSMILGGLILFLNPTARRNDKRIIRTPN